MIEWFLTQHGILLYLFMFLALLGGAVGLPIPEDLPLILGGVLINLGQANPVLLFVVCYLAILLGDIVIFLIGRRLGTGLFNREWFKKRWSKHQITRLRLKLEKRSLLMILLARHLFYLRTMTFLTCGAVKMNFLRFFLADAIAALISVPAMISLGYLAAEHYQIVIDTFNQFKEASIIVCIAVLYVIARKIRKSSKKGPDNSNIKDIDE